MSTKRIEWLLQLPKGSACGRNAAWRIAKMKNRDPLPIPEAAETRSGHITDSVTVMRTMNPSTHETMNLTACAQSMVRIRGHPMFFSLASLPGLTFKLRTV
jgi:hypothetical protein